MKTLQLKIVSHTQSSIDTKQKRNELYSTLNEILIEAWGHFPSSFIRDHVLRAEKIIVAYDSKTKLPIAFCSLSRKTLQGRSIYYIEFLVVKYEYQSRRVGQKLTAYVMKKLFAQNIGALLRGGIEVMFITPNLRVLGSSMEIASIIYPDPRKQDGAGEIPPANDYVWNLSKALLTESYDPDRVLRREGLVLEDSYIHTPWLIFKGKDIPWHKKEYMNRFAKSYLGYGKSQDKELIVYMKVTISSLFLFTAKSILKFLR